MPIDTNAGLRLASQGFLAHLSNIAFAAHERQLALADLVDAHRGDGWCHVDFGTGEYVSGTLRAKCVVIGVLTGEQWEWATGIPDGTLPLTVDIRAGLASLFAQFPEVDEFSRPRVDHVDTAFSHALAALTAWIIGDDAFAAADGANGAKVFLSLAVPEFSLSTSAISLVRKVATTPWLDYIDVEQAVFGYAKAHGLRASRVANGVDISWPDKSAAVVSWAVETGQRRVSVHTR